MHSHLNIWLTLILSAVFLASVNAQQPTRPTGGTVWFREPRMAKSAPQPPPSLRQISVHLSARLVGESPNLSIGFILTLQNNGSEEVKVLDPLDSLSLNFTTLGKKPIPVPRRIKKILVDTSKDKKDMPFPAAIVFRRIRRGPFVGYEKEEVTSIAPVETVQIEFESEPIIMENVTQALRTETGEGAKSFKVEGFLALINAPPQLGGRSLLAAPIVLKIPPVPSFPRVPLPPVPSTPSAASPSPSPGGPR